MAEEKTTKEQEKRIPNQIQGVDEGNFEILTSAFANGDVALMRCKWNGKRGAMLADTNMPVEGEEEYVTVLCAVNDVTDEGDAAKEFMPFAVFFADNPYDLLSPCISADAAGSNTIVAGENVIPSGTFLDSKRPEGDTPPDTNPPADVKEVTHD